MNTYLCLATAERNLRSSALLQLRNKKKKLGEGEGYILNKSRVNPKGLTRRRHARTGNGTEERERGSVDIYIYIYIYKYIYR